MAYRLWLFGSLGAVAMIGIAMADAHERSISGDCSGDNAGPCEKKESDPTRPIAPKPSRGTTRPAHVKEVKRDILGLHLGSSETEISSELAKDGRCIDETRNSRVIQCKMLNEARLVLTLTTKIQPSIVQAIEYKFLSGAAPEKMISTVSEQFGVGPVKHDWSREIAAASIAKKVWVNAIALPHGGSIGGYFLNVAEGQICAWELDGSDLFMTLEYQVPNTYTLKLSSRKLDRAELEALQRPNVLETNLFPKF